MALPENKIMRTSDKTARQFQERLKILNEVTVELSKARTFDDLCRQAVELGRSRLGFDRMGLWFLDADTGMLTGSFGTDETGRTRDERGARAMTEGDYLFRRAIAEERPLIYEADGDLFDHRGAVVGRGWLAEAVLRDGDHVVGYISADNLLHHRSLTDSDLETLRLYGSTLAHLCIRKRAEEALRSSEESALAFQERLKILNEVTIELSKARTFDALCRQAVELGRSRLGFDRLGLWFLDAENATLVGSFGTDESGQIRDERHQRVPVTWDMSMLKSDEEPVRLSYAEDIPLRNEKLEPVGRGWNANAVLWDGDQVIGWIYADNLLHQQPLTRSDRDILRQYGSALGHLCTRKRAEDALRASEEAALAFQERLKILNSVNIELTRAATFDDLCRQAVELGRSRLGFDRLALWFWSDDYQYMLGSFGTDESGATRDERGIRVAVEHDPLVKKARDERLRVAHSEDAPLYNHQGEVVGRGWNAMAMLGDGDEAIGWLSADNFLHQRPISAADLEILALYGSALGNLCARKRAEDALRTGEEAALAFQERLKILHEVSVELAKATTFDQLCRAAVELGRDRLGFDRMGIWFVDERAPDTIVGSFGTDESGHIRDERHIRLPFKQFDDARLTQAVLQQSSRVALGKDDEPIFNDRGEIVGYGSRAVGMLRDGDRIIGVVSIDNLLRQRPITDQDLEILVLYCGILGQLTRRKRVEDALRASEEATRSFQERLKVLYEVSLDLARIPSVDDLCRAAVELGRSRLGFDRLGIWLLDESDPNFMYGTFGTDESGRTRDERGIRLPISEEDRQVLQAISKQLGRAFLGEAPIYNDKAEVVGVGQKALAVLSDGHTIIGTISTDNLLRHRPVTDQDLEILVLFGSTLGYLCSRKRAEEALLKERNLLRTIIDIMPDRIYVKDTASRLLLVNKASWQYVPQASNENDLIGMTDADFMPEEVARQILADEQQLLATGEPILSREEPARDYQGSPIYFLTTKVPLRDSQGNIIGLVGFSRDITDQKQAEQQRLELALQKERVNLLTEFIGNLSHDLKTPLSVIKNSLYLVERLDDPARQQAKIQVMKEQTLRLEKLIQDVITMSRLDHGAPPVFEPVNLNKLIQDVTAKLQPTAERKNLSVTLDLDAQLPPVPADETELWRLVANLYENALQYTPEAGSVTVTTRCHDQSVIAEVSDTGIGVSSADLPHIFDRFYRADPARSLQYGGTGLGLAIVRRIVELHHGSIEVESQPGQGSVFRVILPLTSEGVSSMQTGT